MTRGTNYLASTLDYWTPENQNASSPRLIWTDPNRNARSESDRYLESGSYFRLRNLQVGYTLPTVWFHGFVQKARVYVNAENLFTISSYSGYSMKSKPIQSQLRSARKYLRSPCSDSSAPTERRTKYTNL